MPNDEDFDAVADEVFDEAEGEEEEEELEEEAGQEEAEGSDSEDSASEEPEVETGAAQEKAQSAPAYDHDQLSDAVRRAVQERDQAYALERQRMSMEMQHLKQQIQQVTAPPKQDDSPKLPSIEEWIQAQGDPNLYRYLEQLPQQAATQVQQVHAEIEKFRAEQRQSVIEKEIESHFDSSISTVVAESEHLKDEDGRKFLDNIVYAQAMESMKRGIDPRKFDVAGTAKKFADFIDRRVNAQVKAKVKKVTRPASATSPGKGSPTKAKKHNPKMSTDDLLDRGIDDLVTELGALNQQ